MTPVQTPAALPAGHAAALSIWPHVRRLAVLAALWAGIVGWLGWLLYSRATWAREADEADVREWLSETRVFRKALPELVEDYVELMDTPGGPDPDRLRAKHDEIEAHLSALTEPTRKYAGKLPLFPDVYSLSVEYPGVPPPSGRTVHPAWRSPLPRPISDGKARVRVVECPAGGTATGRAFIRCEYRVHTNHRFEDEQQSQRSWQLPLVLVLVPVTVVSGFFAVRSLRREREHAQAALAVEHRERELLQARVQTQEAEQEAERAARAAEELQRRVLEGELEKAKIEGRAAEAERSALEMKSQLYASIGIMAGSYAHNIKNLLVRPNDLLARCIETDGMTREQAGMLHEVRSTLGTVTERLQQILRTIRRDPNRAEMTRVDLTELVRETHRTWADMAWEKWKVRFTADLPAGPLAVSGDLSHLQQAVENLVFNARDATFEMRNHLREEARRNPGLDATGRKQRLIEAASWKGEVRLRARREGDVAVLEVQDNGVGMTAEVRDNCLKTHFTTKRDNALYEGYSAGMGLGLSFVAVVLEHHGATLEIESAPFRGAVFRIRIPLAENEAAR
ncbi:MAG: Blue-light-activated protein [Gemmataceae bacterium]|nr:Blue-light-activated protein [Gemmataceae bacterium]